jgi:small-conductance mechanosensitive channel
MSFAFINSINPMNLPSAPMAMDTALHKASGGLISMWMSETLISLAIITVAWLVFWLFHRYGFVYLLRFVSGKSHEVMQKFFNCMRTPLSLIFLTFGIWITISRLKILQHHTLVVNQVFLVLGTILTAFILTRLVRALLDLYAHNSAIRTGSPVDTQFIPSIRRILNIIIWIAAFIQILLEFKQEITPLITGLGIGGLAVALALQDSLSNFFSGFYLIMDKPFRIGDFVHLETGNEGFIESIGWRSTKIRNNQNHVIVVPNAKLSQSVVTNFVLAEKNNTFVIECGVGYGNDLEKVERVTKEVALEVLHKVPGADLSFTPIVRFHTFGDSNINFRVILSVVKFDAHYVLKHEFIKALHRRYREENIDIAFPTREIHINNWDDKFFRRGGAP